MNTLKPFVLISALPATRPIAPFVNVRSGDFAARFNPTGFDAREWVRLAKAAGMRHIMITAKHHDGFAMFKSAASPFNIVDATPFKRDPMRELAEACRDQFVLNGFLRQMKQVRAGVTFNVPVNQQGFIPAKSASQLERIGAYLQSLKKEDAFSTD